MKLYLRRTCGFLIVLLTVLTSGCGGPAPSPDDQTPLTYSYSVSAAPVSDSTLPDDVDLGTYVDLTRGFHHRAQTATTWQEAHQRVEAHLQYTRVTPVPRPLREAAAAEAMLRHHFRGRNPSPSAEKLDAIALHVNRFLQVRPTASPLIVPALRILRGHWSDARLATAIDTVLDATQDQYVVNPDGVDPHIPDVHSEVRTSYRTL